MFNKIKSKRNCIRFSPNEGWHHFIQKCVVCYLVKNKDFDFYTECEFVKPYKGKCDILVMTQIPFIIEIIDSEKEVKKHKLENYPYEIISIKAKDQIEKVIDILDI